MDLKEDGGLGDREEGTVDVTCQVSIPDEPPRQGAIYLTYDVAYD